MEFSFNFRDKVYGINCVYQIRNILNNKSYIGSTIIFKKRILSHYALLQNNSHHSIKLQRSWNKYGEKFFLFSIIEENIDNNDLINREQFYINLFNSSINGFNILPNAGSTLGNSWSERAKENYSRRKKELLLGKRVIKFNLNGEKINEYPSLKHAAKSLGLNRDSNIGQCCRKKKKTVGGFIWEFKDVNEQKKFGFHDFQVNIISCPNCESCQTVKSGFSKQENNIKQVYRCKSCNKRFIKKQDNAKT